MTAQLHTETTACTWVVNNKHNNLIFTIYEVVNNFPEEGIHLYQIVLGLQVTLCEIL